MSYVVSARKYRPQTFEDVVGQEHITSTLKNALLSDKLAHAFLFCGPRGVGKTTCARLLAKVINMDDPKAAIADGSYADTQIDISLNIIELDAASNNSVEDIRRLNEQVRFQPQHGKYKVFIIDEVHMLTQSAFNAFLKTLEEPPPYAIFILATTEKHKILPTIMSRCQIYDFRRIMIPDIITNLESIAKKEGIEAEHDGLYVIAEKADGAMRDALSIFDRVASAGLGKITYKSVVQNLSILDFEYYFKGVDLLLTEDASSMLLLLDEVLHNGFEGDTFIIGLAKHMRDLMYCKQEPTQRLLQVSAQLKERYLHQSQAISYATILTVLNLANHCDINYPRAKDKRLHVEMALLKMVYAGRQILPGAQPTQGQAVKKNPSPEPIEQALPLAESSKQETTPTLSATTASVSQEPTEESKETSVLPVTQDPEESTPQKEEAVPAVDSVKVVNTPTISSVEDLLKAARTKVANKSTVKRTLVLEEITDLWQTYSDHIPSPTTQVILKNVYIKIDGGSILVTVPSMVAKEEIQQEAVLYSQLRDHFNMKDLVINVQIDRAQFPDLEERKVKKYLSAKEKYDHLKEKNPLIDQLIDEMGMSPEQD